MFKKINNLVKIKKDYIIKSNNNNNNLNKALKSFLIKEFGGNINIDEIIQNSVYANNKFYIIAKNKIIANELVLKSGSLNIFLKNNNIAVNQIIIK